MVDINERSRSAIGWTLAALGQTVFLAVHLVQAVGELAAESGSHLAEFETMAEPGAMWLLTAWSALYLAPPLIVLLSGARWAAWAALAIGSVMGLLAVADGVNHAVADGAVQPLVAALLVVGIPTVIAFAANRSWLNNTPAPIGTRSHQEVE